MHTVKPLPFDASKLRGLSERLIVSHHENNYGGAVKNLHRTEEELARVTRDTPPFVVAALKERELTFANSATLHELYFGNLGGDGRPGGPAADAVGARMRDPSLAGRIRARVRARLRRGRGRVRRRVFPEHPVGRSQPAPRERAKEKHMMVAILLVAAAAAGAPDWKPVQEIFGFDGSALPGGVIRFNMPRSDLHVTAGGVDVKPGLALGGWAALAPMGKGSAMIMGDLVLTADEVPPVTNALLDGGVEVTAIHNHLLGESPQILYLHMGGHGDPVKMAQAVVKAVGTTKTPMPPAAGSKAETDLGFDQAAVEKAVGAKGNVSGGVLHFNVPRAEKVSEEGMPTPPSMGMGTAINFQPTGSGKAAIAGDFAMTGKEVGPVLDVLRKNGIVATALHSHALDDVPRLFYMHFWANDDALKLAQALGAALAKTNVKR